MISYIPIGLYAFPNLSLQGFTSKFIPILYQIVYNQFSKAVKENFISDLPNLNTSSYEFQLYFFLIFF